MSRPIWKKLSYEECQEMTKRYTKRLLSNNTYLEREWDSADYTITFYSSILVRIHPDNTYTVYCPRMTSSTIDRCRHLSPAKIFRSKNVLYRSETFKKDDLDKMWEENKGLVYEAARRISIRKKCDYKELLGELLLFFNQRLHTFDPKVAKFTTHFCAFLNGPYMHDFYIKKIAKNESEYARTQFRQYTNRTNILLKGAVEAAVHYDLPPEDLSAFDLIKPHLTDREFFIFKDKYTHNRSDAAIGKDLGLSKEWVRQLRGKVVEKLRKNERLWNTLQDCL